jgi:hypothetical protein
MSLYEIIFYFCAACFLSSSTHCDAQNDFKWSDLADLPKISERMLKANLQVKNDSRVF